MITPAPDFMDWVIVDQNGWTLKDSAPADVVKKFKAYMGETGRYKVQE